MVGYRILTENILEGDVSNLVVERQMADGRIWSGPVQFTREGDNWKRVIPEELPDEIAGKFAASGTKWQSATEVSRSVTDHPADSFGASQPRSTVVSRLNARFRPFGFATMPHADLGLRPRPPSLLPQRRSHSPRPAVDLDGTVFLRHHQ
jgi:hypothetical protein